MPPHSVGNEPPRARNASVLRSAGFAVAVILGAVAIWLIVTSTSQKRIEIGVLAGLWGLLLGAFSVFGSRHPQRTDAAGAGHQLALRGSGELERADDAAARRHFEARLEHLLRREIQTSMAREVSSLREEVASLRTELLDKVGGQLRLERIETTRVIGSDIEAIKREVNQLKGARLFGEPGQSSAPVTRITSSRVVQTQTETRSDLAAEPYPDPQAQPERPEHAGRPAQPNSTTSSPPVAPVRSFAAEIHDAVVVEEPATGVFAQFPTPRIQPADPPERAAAPAASPPPAAPPRVAFAPPSSSATQRLAPPEPPIPVRAATVAQRPAAPPAAEAPNAAPPAQPEPFVPPVPAAAPAPPVPPAPEPIDDTFAGLPRLRPFTDFELDPIEPTPDPPSAYSGRRRADAPPPRRGRHGADDDPGPELAGRRHRPSEGDSDNDVLSQILQRENVR